MYSSSSFLNFFQSLCVCVGIATIDMVLGNEVLNTCLMNKYVSGCDKL